MLAKKIAYNLSHKFCLKSCLDFPQFMFPKKIAQNFSQNFRSKSCLNFPPFLFPQKKCWNTLNKNFPLKITGASGSQARTLPRLLYRSWFESNELFKMTPSNLLCTYHQTKVMLQILLKIYFKLFFSACFFLKINSIFY